MHAKPGSRQDSTAVSTAVQSICLSMKKHDHCNNPKEKKKKVSFLFRDPYLYLMKLAGNAPILLQMQNSKKP